MIPPDEFYIVVDIESSGPVPGEYALLSIGAATLSTPPETFYIELQPDAEAFTEEALQINQLDLEVLKREAFPPGVALQKFAEWTESITPAGKLPIFVAFNAPFDWMFVNVYFHRYLGYNPYGYKALDIKAMFMGKHHVPFIRTSHNAISEHYDLKDSLSHHALEDAVQEALIFKKILTEIF